MCCIEKDKLATMFKLKLYPKMRKYSVYKDNKDFLTQLFARDVQEVAEEVFSVLRYKINYLFSEEDGELVTIGYSIRIFVEDCVPWGWEEFYPLESLLQLR